MLPTLTVLPVASHVVGVTLAGLLIGYGLARLSDKWWPRCRAHSQLAVHEPLFAVGLAVTFGLYGYRDVSGLVLLKGCLFAATMFVVLRVNLRTLLVPNAITLPGVAVGVCLGLATPPGVKEAIVGMLVGGGMLWSVSEAYYRARGSEGVGMGLVKLLAVVGAFLGWRMAAAALVIAAVTGSIVAVWATATGRIDPENGSMPFGAYLAMSGVVVLISGQEMLDWYLSQLN